MNSDFIDDKLQSQMYVSSDLCKMRETHMTVHHAGENYSNITTSLTTVETMADRPGICKESVQIDHLSGHHDLEIYVNITIFINQPFEVLGFWGGRQTMPSTLKKKKNGFHREVRENAPLKSASSTTPCVVFPGAVPRCCSAVPPCAGGTLARRRKGRRAGNWMPERPKGWKTQCLGALFLQTNCCFLVFFLVSFFFRWWGCLVLLVLVLKLEVGSLIDSVWRLCL